MSIGNVRVMRRIRAMNPEALIQPVNATEVWFKDELEMLSVVDPIWIRRSEMYTWFTEEGWAEVGSELLELALSRGYTVCVHEEIEAAAPHVYSDAWQNVRYPDPQAGWLHVRTGRDELQWYCSASLAAKGYDGQAEINRCLQESCRKRKATAQGLPQAASWSEIYDARRLSEARRFGLPDCATWRAVIDRRRRSAALNAGFPASTEWPVVRRQNYVDAQMTRLKQMPRLDQTLVVVDVQMRFVKNTWAHVKLITQTVSQIRLARALGWPIVLARMIDPGTPDIKNDLGDIHPAVVRALTFPTRYERFAVVSKIQQDGSEQVLSACDKLGAGKQRFRVVGLFTHQCVIATVCGISAKLPGSAIEVLKRACFPQGIGCWEPYLNIPNVLLLPVSVTRTICAVPRTQDHLIR